MGIFDKLSKKNDLVKANMGDVSNAIYINNENSSNYEYSDVIMMNDGVNICSRACAVCWDTKLPADYDKRAEYIGKRTRIGHTSVIEHSNLVLYMEINIDKYYTDLIEFLSSTRFLHTKFAKSNLNKDLGYLIIGGSWRAYADLYKVMSNHSNYILMRVTNMVYKYIHADGMRDIIEYGILDKENFANLNLTNAAAMYNRYNSKDYIINDNLECVNCDDIEVLIKSINTQCPEPELFTIYDLLQFCTITINFKNMSRIISQQLTRHRNGITQESQRYVDYSKGSFNSPAKFRPDLYDAKHKYPISFGNGTTMYLTLQEIGDSIASIYGQLTDKSPKNAKYALKYEDARGFLPNNIQCGTIYITFTWQNFLTFLYLREDPHAQAEFRQYGIELGKWFRSLYPDYGNAIESIKPFNTMDENSFFRQNTRREHYIGGIHILPDLKNYEEIINTHLENYDESKEDSIEEEPGETVLKHGEI